MLIPQMNKLSTDVPVLRRQLYRAYRTWLTGMGVYRPARILHRKKRTDFYQKWDFRFCDRQTPELASLLMHEVPVAMAAACRDATRAGRTAFLAGRMEKRAYASASSPIKDF
jgi:hypothetical protein